MKTKARAVFECLACDRPSMAKLPPLLAPKRKWPRCKRCKKMLYLVRPT